MQKTTLYGIVTASFFGTTKFSKKDEMYRISLKVDKANMDALKKACDEMYKEAEDGFIPKWYKADDVEYINLKSKFDIPVVFDGDKELTSLDGFLKKYGNINGSKVGVALKIDKGAIYPIAVKIYELTNTDFSDLFDEELPF